MGARMVADAQTVGNRIEAEFDRAADSVGQSFSAVGSRISSDLSGVRADASRVATAVASDFETAGDRAGQSFASGIEAGLANIDVGSVGTSIANQLQSFGAGAGPIGGAALAIGLTFADELVAGFDRGFNARRRQLMATIQTGLSPAELAPIGAAAGDAYTDGFGESLGQLRETSAIVSNALSDIDDSLDLSESTRQAQVLNDVFGVDIPRSTEIAGRMVSQGLARDTTEAFDIMIGSAQQYMNIYDEIHDVLREFGTTFSELGIDGAAAAEFIGEAWRQGLVPTIDRAGELFEEFVIEITAGVEGRAAPALEAMGISIRDVQDELASGRGKEAIVDLANELLAMEDTVRRNELAVEIFGTAVESASDKTAVLELIASIDDLGGSFDGAASEAVDAASEMQTEFDKLQRTLEGVAAAVAESFAEDFNDRLRNTAEEVAVLQQAWQWFLDDLGVGQEEIGKTVGAIDELAEGGGRAGGAWGEAAEAIQSLNDALADFSGRFTEDRIFRSIEEDVVKLTASMADMEAGTYNAASGFDITTAAGRELQSQAEALSGNLDRLVQGFNDGTVSADALSAGQARVESALREAAAAAGLTTGQTETLIATYGRVPDNVHTDVSAETGQAESALGRVIALIGSIDRNVGVTITGTLRMPSIPSSITIPGRVSLPSNIREQGGPVGGSAEVGGHRGETVLVNEAGLESARLPNGNLVELPTGSTVFSHADTDRMRMTGELGGNGETHYHSHVHTPAVLSTRDLKRVLQDMVATGELDFAGRR